MEGVGPLVSVGPIPNQLDFSIQTCVVSGFRSVPAYISHWHVSWGRRKGLSPQGHHVCACVLTSNPWRLFLFTPEGPFLPRQASLPGPFYEGFVRRRAVASLFPGGSAGGPFCPSGPLLPWQAFALAFCLSGPFCHGGPLPWALLPWRLCALMPLSFFALQTCCRASLLLPDGFVCQAGLVSPHDSFSFTHPMPPERPFCLAGHFPWRVFLL